MEQGVMVSNKGCSACAVGAACLADGPIHSVWLLN